MNVSSHLAATIITNVNFDHYLQNTYNHAAIKFHMIDERNIILIIEKLKNKFISGSYSIFSHLLISSHIYFKLFNGNWKPNANQWNFSWETKVSNSNPVF